MQASHGKHGLILRNKGVKIVLLSFSLTLLGLLAYSIIPDVFSESTTECTTDSSTEHSSVPCMLVVNGVQLDTYAYICNDSIGEYIEIPFLQVMAALGAEIDQSDSGTNVRIVYNNQAYLLDMDEVCLLRDDHDSDDAEYAPLNLLFPAPGAYPCVRHRVDHEVFYVNRGALLTFFSELHITIRGEMLDENSYYLNIFSR